jgi:hypothetical protein
MLIRIAMRRSLRRKQMNTGEKEYFYSGIRP